MMLNMSNIEFEIFASPNRLGMKGSPIWWMDSPWLQQQRGMGKMEVRRKTKDNTIYVLYTLIQCCPLGHWCSILQFLAGSPSGIEDLQILFLFIPRLLPLRPVHGFLRQVLFLTPAARRSSTSFCHLSNSAWSRALKYKAALADFEP